MDTATKLAIKNTNKGQSYSKKYYDRNKLYVHNIEIGGKALLRNFNEKEGKLKSYWADMKLYINVVTYQFTLSDQSVNQVPKQSVSIEIIS